MKSEPNDPVIDEIREVRRRISAQFDHDPRRLVEHLMELQKQHADRLLKSNTDTSEKDRVSRLPFKEEAHRLIDLLSDQATWEDLVRAICERQAIESGLRDSSMRRVTSVEEVRKQYGLPP